jgi:hypothetical protein
MAEFGLCIATVNLVGLGKGTPLIYLLIVSQILNGHEEHRNVDSEWVL